MKKQRTILTYLGVWWRAACWCALVVGLTLTSLPVMAELTPITLEHDGVVYSAVVFSPDGTLLATLETRSNKVVGVWEIPSGNLLATLKHDGSVRSVAFSPDGTLLATRSKDRIWVWEMPSGKRLATLRNDDSIYCLAFSPDGTLLAMGSYDRTAKVWEIPSGKLLATLNHRQQVGFVMFSPDGTLLVTDPAIVWEMPSGKWLDTLKYGGDSVYAREFSPDGTLLATRSKDSVVVWEMPSRKRLSTLYLEVRDVVFSPDGTLLIGAGTGTAKVWEMPSGNLFATLKHGDRPLSAAFSPYGTLLATSSVHRQSSEPIVKVWGMPSGKLLATLKHGDDAYSFTFNPDGTLLVTGGTNDDTTRVWEMPSGRLLAALKHDGGGVAFSPDGTLLVTGSKVWTPSVDETPALAEPPDGGFSEDLPELKWRKVSNALYQVQVATDKDFSQVVMDAFIDKELLKVVGMGKLAPGTYFWRVRTVGWIDFGEWSEPWSFRWSPVNIISAPVLNVTRTDFDFEMKGLKNITIEIKIDKAQNLYGFQFDLQFDPNVLEAIKVTEGDFLKSIGGNTSFMKPSIDNSAGIIKSVVASRMSPGEVSGSGVLAKVEFNFKKAGTSLITFPLIKLSNEQFQSIDYAYVNGSATLNITPTTPSAKIQVQPSIVDNQVMAKVLIENAVNLRGYSVDLEYPSALELLDVSQGDFLKEGWQQTTPSANTVRFSASKAKGELVEGSGEIATLTFRIWEGGEQPFTLKNGTLTAPVVTNIYTPELQGSAITVVASPNWEVNKDYVVDMQDIVILGIDFDKKIEGNPRPNPDVTRDGLVDLFDLVAVASHYPDEYSAVPQPPAAPAVMKRTAHNLPVPTAAQRSILQELYDRVARYPDTDASVLAVKRLLKCLISGAEPTLPQKTRLAQNYPNPFNPETWIPFELAEAADVTIKIYDAKGQLVRTLALGQQPAGFYLTQARAAYWNGRNDSGELLASGVYFYTLKAGKFTATKKFVVLK